MLKSQFIRCNIIKYVFCVAIILLSTDILAQDSLKIDIAIKGYSIFSESHPLLLDSVMVSYGKERMTRTYRNTNKKDSIFKINDLPVGKHTIFPFSKNFIIAPIPIIICTKCKTDIDFRALPNKDEFKGMIYDKVEIDASYEGGGKAMLRDLQISLDNVEISKIKEAPDFNIHIYITSNKEISDISFSPFNLDKDIKLILIKAVNSLSNWRVAILNGKKTDGEYNLSKKTFNQLQ